MICKNCEKRRLKCHADCDDYKRYQELQKAICATRYAESITAGYQIDYFTKLKIKKSKE